MPVLLGDTSALKTYQRLSLWMLLTPVNNVSWSAKDLVLTCHVATRRIRRPKSWVLDVAPYTGLRQALKVKDAEKYR